MHGRAGLQAVHEVLDRVLEGWLQHVYRHHFAGRVSAGLHADRRLVVVRTDRPLRAHDHKAALGLRLVRPRVGEGAPARLELGQALGVARQRDAVLVNFETGRFIDHRHHLDRFIATVIPCPQRHAVTEIVKQRAAALIATVEPALGFARGRRLRRHLDFVRHVIEGTAIAVVVMHLDHLTDHAFIDQPFAGDVRRIPGQGPVDDHLLARRRHRRDHAIGFRQ